MTTARHGSVIRLFPEKIATYKKLHHAVWPDVQRLIHAANIRNYTTYLRRLADGSHYLFSYFEYVGRNFDGDMSRMADHPVTQEWWAICEPCHDPLPDRATGEWWAGMQEIFHLD